jgi:hypothetical protein
MFGIKSGSWWLSSESDPRWNCDGRAEYLAFTAGTPSEVTDRIEALRKTLGEPPADLEYRAMKD